MTETKPAKMWFPEGYRDSGTPTGRWGCLGRKQPIFRILSVTWFWAQNFISTCVLSVAVTELWIRKVT